MVDAGKQIARDRGGEMAELRLPPLVEAAVGQFKKALIEQFGARIAGLRLFGSYARGEAGAESDVDILVLLEGATRPEANEIVGLASDLGFVGDSYVVMSAFVRTPEQFAELRRRELRIALDIDREGVPI
jgi:uncharacterized protein